MGFLEQFTHYEVFLVALGLVIASLIRIFYDSVQERKQIKQLSESLKVYSESIDMYEEAVVMISDKGEIIFFNKEASRIFGSNQEVLDIEHLRKRVSIRLERTIEEQNFLEVIQNKKNITNAYIITKNLSVPVSVNTNKFYMSFDRDSFWQVIIVQDLTSKVKLQERVKSVGSYKDLLTGLPTRYHLTHDLVSVIVKSANQNNKSALGIFGIREFHSLRVINGLEQIDSLMKIITKGLLEILLENETLYRFECDSFAIIFEDSSDKNGIRKRLNYIIIKLQNILVSQKLNVNTIQGLHFIGQVQPTAEEVIYECFKALRSKNNEIIIKTGETLKLSFDGNKIETTTYDLKKNDFQHAIENRDFFFFYQPIVDLESNEFIGVEVLTRLNHKEYGFLVADDFLDKAIEFGMASEITTYLLDSVLSQKKIWSMDSNTNFDLTINLALSDLQSGVFAETLENKLMEYKIEPSSIIIDIPEIILSEDFDSIIEEFHMLNKIGVKLSIDHFGKDFVNLRHIEQLPLYAIKIDKSIILDIVGNEHKMRLVSSIISMGKKFGIKVGANYVDSYQIRDLLIDLDCDFAQGYYFGKAVPAFELNKLMQNNSL